MINSNLAQRMDVFDLRDFSKLGRILLRRQHLTETQLRQALSEQVVSGKKLGEVCVNLGFCTADDVAAALNSQQKSRFVVGRTEPSEVLDKALHTAGLGHLCSCAKPKE